jgi:hypothetical protein
VSSLATGFYSLTAVATASGVSSTSSVVNITVVTPTSVSVSIANPLNGAVFTAPAKVSIVADATVTGGTVTNVSFFNGASPLGSVTTPPFVLTFSNLTAGAYSLTAVATASGISSTSSIVDITVVTPTAISLSAPVITNGLFSFSCNVDPGLKYLVESSSDLFQWIPVVTNVASSNPMLFSTDISTNVNRYFRVSRLAIP